MKSHSFRLMTVMALLFIATPLVSAEPVSGPLPTPFIIPIGTWTVTPTESQGTGGTVTPSGTAGVTPVGTPWQTPMPPGGTEGPPPTPIIIPIGTWTGIPTETPSTGETVTSSETKWMTPVGTPGPIHTTGSITNNTSSGNRTDQNSTPVLAPLTAGLRPPTDPDHDGLYEDLNGNGETDFGDVVLLFNTMDTISVEENAIPAYDFNRNGRIDFLDVVTLFTRM